MSLLDIKTYMMQVKKASLASLCLCFKREPETLRFMLLHWINKGKIRKCSKESACGSKCFKCPQEQIEIYEWVFST